MLKTALICHADDKVDSEGLPLWLASFSELVGIVTIQEPASRKRTRLKSELKRVGPLRILDVLAFRAFYKLALQGRDTLYKQQALASIRKTYSPLPAATPIVLSSTANSIDVQEFLRSRAPDIVIARCKSLLKREVYSIPKLGTFVMHPGICPEYRNAHGCFWALTHRDLTKVGMSLLKIDDGIDTGPVFGYFTYLFDEQAESHIVIQYRSVFENLDAIRDRLLAIANGEAKPLETSGRPSANWGQPWLSKYIRWKTAARWEALG